MYFLFFLNIYFIYILNKYCPLVTTDNENKLFQLPSPRIPKKKHSLERSDLNVLQWKAGKCKKTSGWSWDKFCICCAYVRIEILLEGKSIRKTLVIVILYSRVRQYNFLFGVSHLKIAANLQNAKMKFSKGIKEGKSLCKCLSSGGTKVMFLE